MSCGPVFCLPETVDGAVGVLEWPETPSGRRTSLPCPAGGRDSPDREEEGERLNHEDSEDGGQSTEDREDGRRPAVATRRCLRPTGHSHQPQWEEADTRLCRDQRQVGKRCNMLTKAYGWMYSGWPNAVGAPCIILFQVMRYGIPSGAYN